MSETESMQEMAAVGVLGALDGLDARAFGCLREFDPAVRAEALAFLPVIEALAAAVPPVAPPASLRERILAEVTRQQAASRARDLFRRLSPRVVDGFANVHALDPAGWRALSVAGAYMKLLSFDDRSQHAIVMARLDPAGRYPEHDHRHPEDLYMISGDLHVGDRVLRAGDFHHAEAGTHHDVNWSEGGCVLLAVVAKDDLLTMMSR